MADFLSRLAGRALGQVPLVQPILAPRFAPSPALAGDGALDHPATGAGTWMDTGDEASETAIAEMPRGTAEARIRSAPIAARGAAPERQQGFARGGARWERDESLERMERWAGADRKAGRGEYADGLGGESVTGTHLAWLTARPSEAAPAEERSRSEPQAVARPPVTVRPAPLDEPRAGAPFGMERRMGREPLPAPAAPTIHVTIGRVDVRAVPTATPQAPRPRATPHGLTLDEYLRQRDTGGRR